MGSNKEKPYISIVLFLPKDLGPLTIRFIVVPLSVHKKYNSSAKINLVLPAAWNIGIRRAKGQFILPTNTDILFSDELISFLSLENLKKDIFYRTVRYGVNIDNLKTVSFKNKFDFWKKNIPEADTESRISPHGLAGHPALLTFCGADFLVLCKENWKKMNGDILYLTSFLLRATNWRVIWPIYPVLRKRF